MRRNDLSRAATLLVLSAALSSAACLHSTTRAGGDGKRPQICIDVFDTEPSLYVDGHKLDRYSIEELLVLQRCGLAYTPQVSLVQRIVNHPDYPVPVLLRSLEAERDEEMQTYIIAALAELSESERHRERLRADKDVVLKSVDATVAGMRDRDLKRSASAEAEKLRRFF